MAKQNVTSPELEAVNEAVSKTEQFFEKNGKKVTYAIIALVVVAVAIFGYKKLMVEPKIESASAMLYKAQLILDRENPDYLVALEGDATTPGFLEVVETYGATPSGNLAKHYAGICYLHLADFDNAAAYLSKFKAVKGIPGSLINAQNLGLQGDVAVEKGDFAASVALYKKAVAASDNLMTAPAYLFKAGLAAVAAGDSAQAKDLFTTITVKYENSEEANNAYKYLSSLN